MGEIGDEVRGVIDQAALSRTPQMFDLSAATIVSELLQNARRAGATAVAIEMADTDDCIEVRVSDDGSGVSDFSDLVTFGRSGWDEAVSAAENWAGMGVFVLAARGCRIHSLAHRVTLTPDVFTGRASAVVEDAPFRHGTEVVFRLPGSVSDDDMDGVAAREGLVRAVLGESMHLPVPVTLNGARVPSAPFLANALSVHVFEGVEIGLFDRTRLERRRTSVARLGLEFLRRFQQGAGREAGTMDHGDYRPVNFWGHSARAPGDLGVSDRNRGWRALWNVGEDARIRLRLPTRDSVIDDEAWARLLHATRCAIWRDAASRRVHYLAMEEVAAARGAGVAMPDPEPALLVLVDAVEERMEILEAGEPEEEEDTEGHVFDSGAVVLGTPGASGAVLLPVDTSATATVAIVAALRRMPDPPLVLHPDNRLQGHPLYDAVPRIARVELACTWPDGRRTVLPRLHEGWDALDEGRPSTARFLDACGSRNPEDRPARMTITLVTEPGDDGRARRVGPVPIPVLFMEKEEEPASEADPLVVRGATRGEVETAALEMVAVTYDPDEFLEWDEDEGREVCFLDGRAVLEDLLEVLASFFMTPDQHRMREVRKAAEHISEGLENAPVRLRRLCVRVQGRGARARVVVTAEDEDGVEAEIPLDRLLAREERFRGR